MYILFSQFVSLPYVLAWLGHISFNIWRTFYLNQIDFLSKVSLDKKDTIFDTVSESLY
jgi:hypothetical protein